MPPSEANDGATSAVVPRRAFRAVDGRVPHPVAGERHTLGPLAAVEVIIGAVVVARALASLGSDLSAWQIVVFICAVIMSVSILYSLTTSKSM